MIEMSLRKEQAESALVGGERSRKIRGDQESEGFVKTQLEPSFEIHACLLLTHAQRTWTFSYLEI